MVRSRLAVPVAVCGAIIVVLVALIGGAASAAAPGALDPKGCIDDNDTGTSDCGAHKTNGLNSAKGVVVSPDGKFVYVAAENDDAIVMFKRKASGKLKPMGCVDDNDTGTDPTQGEDNCAKSTNGLAQPSALAVSRDGKSLYVTSEADDAVVMLKRKANGKLKPKGCIDDNDTGTDPSQGEDNCAKKTDGMARPASLTITRDGKSVYVVSEQDDAVVWFDRSSDGSLKPKGCIDDHETGTDPTQGEDACSVSTAGLQGDVGVVASPDGKSVYVSAEDEGIARFVRSHSGVLAPAGCIQDQDSASTECPDTAEGLTGTDSLAVSPDGKSLYATSESDNALVRFNRSSNGALTDKGCFQLTGGGDCADDLDALDEPAVIAISRDGDSLYVTAEGSSAVLRFDRNGKGKLDERGCVEDTGVGGTCSQHSDGLDEPEGLALSPNGKSLYVASTVDNAVVTFKRAG